MLTSYLAPTYTRPLATVGIADRRDLFPGNFKTTGAKGKGANACDL
jgi:hypothetical protein